MVNIYMAKFLLELTPSLRAEIKRQARKEGITMNGYIVTVVEQFIQLQKGKHNGKNAERNCSGE